MRQQISTGFSLLEVMIGMAILAAGLMGTSAAMFTAINADEHTKERDLALQAIESTLEDILTNPFIASTQFAGSYGVRGLQVPPSSTQSDVLQVRIVPVVVGGTPDPSVLRITLRAEWLHRESTESMQITYIHTNRGG